MMLRWDIAGADRPHVRQRPLAALFTDDEIGSQQRRLEQLEQLSGQPIMSFGDVAAEIDAQNEFLRLN